jgi:hypothetical protein
VIFEPGALKEFADELARRVAEQTSALDAKIKFYPTTGPRESRLKFAGLHPLIDVKDSLKALSEINRELEKLFRSDPIPDVIVQELQRAIQHARAHLAAWGLAPTSIPGSALAMLKKINMQNQPLSHQMKWADETIRQIEELESKQEEKDREEKRKNEKLAEESLRMHKQWIDDLKEREEDELKNRKEDLERAQDLQKEHFKTISQTRAETAAEMQRKRKR